MLSKRVLLPPENLLQLWIEIVSTVLFSVTSVESYQFVLPNLSLLIVLWLYINSDVTRHMMTAVIISKLLILPYIEICERSS